MENINGLSVTELYAPVLYGKSGASSVLLYHVKVTSGAAMFVVSGHAGVTINYDNSLIYPGDILTMVRGGFFSVNYCSDDFRAYLITFSSDFIRDTDLMGNMVDTFGVMALNPVLKAGAENNTEIIGKYFEIIYETYRAKGLTFRAEMIKNMFEALLFCVNGLYNDRFGTPQKGDDLHARKSLRSDSILNCFITLVAGNYMRERGISYYADKMCVTPKYLSHAVRSASGILPSALISQAVVMDAKGKLKSTGMSVGEISESLNFPNTSFFCKYFRRHTGTTPKKYKDTINAGADAISRTDDKY